jgi:hypothetical protein
MKRAGDIIIASSFVRAARGASQLTRISCFDAYRHGAESTLVAIGGIGGRIGAAVHGSLRFGGEWKSVPDTLLKHVKSGQADVAVEICR